MVIAVQKINLKSVSECKRWRIPSVANLVVVVQKINLKSVFKVQKIERLTIER